MSSNGSKIPVAIFRSWSSETRQQLQAEFEGLGDWPDYDIEGFDFGQPGFARDPVRGLSSIPKNPTGRN